MEQDAKHLGGELRRTSNLIRQRLWAIIAEGDESAAVTGEQGMLLGLLAKMKTPMPQKDLERYFQTRRSTITVALQGLENRGLIYRQLAPGSGRSKIVGLTPEGEACETQVRANLEQMERELKAGLTVEEIEEFVRILHHINRNLGGEETLPIPCFGREKNDD